MFFCNELQSPELRNDMRLPMRFITFAIMRGKMYRQSGGNGIFITDQGRTWGNKVVYGSIYLLDEDDFYIRSLDAYHGCSLHTLRVNHSLDTQHRINTTVTPITFSTLEELSLLLYKERDEIAVQAYVGNLKHNKIKPRTLDNGRHRITDGIYIEPYLKQYQEVSNEK